MSEKKVKVTIDGIEAEVPAGINTIEAAKLLGIEIPHFCYHPALSVSGNCRMCLIELELGGRKLPKLQIACGTKVQDGMVVNTNTETVTKARKGVLEFILINHPIDCPICDQAGECMLQDNYYKYDLGESRFIEEKVQKAKRFDLGPELVLDADRCILCARCVRFLKEYTGTEEMGIFNRGDHSEVGLFDGKKVDNIYSMNLADLCPVGAITTKDFRFKSRVWFLNKTDSICNGCDRGCNITIDEKDNYILRIKPRYNEDVNGYFMCDDGRLLYHKYYDKSRIADPMKREEGTLKTAKWNEITWEIRELLKDSKKAGEKIVAIASAQGSNEDLYVFNKLFSEEINADVYYKKDMDASGFSVVEDDKLIRKDKNPNSKGAENLGMRELSDADSLINESSVVVVWGEGLERYISSLDILKDKKVIYIGPFINKINDYAVYVLPSTLHVEKNGSFTNFEGKVQNFNKAVNSPENAKPEWDIFSGILHGFDSTVNYNDVEQIFNEINAK